MNKKLFKRIFLGLAVLFLLLFAGRFSYELLNYGKPNNQNFFYDNQSGYESRLVRNYASQKMEYVAEGQAITTLDQKYERIATVSVSTLKYDDDMADFAQLQDRYQAVIQRENQRGLIGNRRVDLIIGVRPENFDAMAAAVAQIGTLLSSTTTKVDKTYEYRQMVAEKEILEQRKRSYEDLRRLGGSITELLQLEETIIGVEAEIRQQLINLGEYSDDNALCTINFSMQERARINYLDITFSSLGWTLMTYITLCALLGGSALTALLASLAWEIVGKVHTFLKKADNNSAGNKNRHN